MAEGNPEVIILSSSDEEGCKPQVTMQFPRKQKKRGYPAAQVKSIHQVQSRYSSKSQTVNITNQPMVSKNGTRIIALPVHKDQNIIVDKRNNHNVPNSVKPKTYYPSQQLQIAKSVKPVPQKNLGITKSVLHTQNFSRNNIASKISSQPVVRTSTPKPTSSKLNPPVLKFGSNLTITPKSTEVKLQNSNKTSVSPSVISALEKKGISVTNVYEDTESNIIIPKKTAASENDFNNLKSKLIKSHIDIVSKTNTSSSRANPVLNFKSPQVNTQGRKRKYSNFDAFGPSSVPSAKKVANYSNHNLVNPSSSQYIKQIASSSKNLSINPVKNNPLKNGSQIKIVEKPAIISSSSKNPSNVVSYNFQNNNSKKSCFVPKTYLKHPEKTTSLSSLQQTVSKRHVSIIANKSSQSSLVKENSDKRPINSLFNSKKSTLNLDATDLKNSLAKKIDSDLIVCYSSFPPSNKSVNPSKKPIPCSSITKLPNNNVTKLPHNSITKFVSNSNAKLPNNSVNNLPAPKVTDNKLFKQITVNNSVKKTTEANCKKIDLSKDRSALLNLLALCDMDNNSSSRNMTISTNPVKNNVNAAVKIIPSTDKLLPSYNPKNNIIESMKVQEIKDRTRNWPKLVVSLKKLDFGTKNANKSLSTKLIVKTPEPTKEITIENGQSTEEVNHPKSSFSQLSSNATESQVTCTNSASVHQFVNKKVSTEVKDKGFQNPMVLKNSQQTYSSVTASLIKPVDKCSSIVLAPGLTIETINLSDSNFQFTNEKSHLNKELKVSNSNNSQSSTNVINKQDKCLNIKTISQTDDSSDLVKVQNKKLENIMVYEKAHQNKSSDTNSPKIPLDKDTNKLLSVKPIIKTIYLPGSAGKNISLSKDLKVKTETKTNSNDNQSSKGTIRQVECSDIKKFLLQPMGIDLYKDNHLNSMASKKSGTETSNSQVHTDTDKNISMKPIIKTVNLSGSGQELSDNRIQLSTEQKSLKDIQVNSKCHTDSNNTQLYHRLTHNQVESSNLKSRQQDFDLNELSKIEETDFQNSHQSDDCSIDLNKNEGKCNVKKLSNQLVNEKLNLSDSDSKLDRENAQENKELLNKDLNKNEGKCNVKKLSNQLVNKKLNLSDSDSKLDRENAQENKELLPSSDIELSPRITIRPTECSNINPIQLATNNVIALPYFKLVSNLPDSDCKLDKENKELLTSSDIELSPRITIRPAECSNINPIQLATNNVIALPYFKLVSNLPDSDCKLDSKKMQKSEELELLNETELSANVTNSTAENSKVTPIQQAVDNIKNALPNAVDISNINEQNVISENSRSNCSVTDALEEEKNGSNLKSNNNASVYSSSKDSLSKMVNNPIASVISFDSSCFSLNGDIKMTLIDKQHNLSQAGSLNNLAVDCDLLGKSEKNIIKSLKENKSNECPEIVKQPLLVSSLNPVMSHTGDLSYNPASVIVKNLLRIIISNVEELNSENNSIGSNVSKVTEDYSSMVPKYETNLKISEKSVTNSVKSLTEKVAEEKESRISTCMLDQVDTKCSVKEIDTTKLHDSEDLLLCPLTSEAQDSRSKRIVDQGGKKLDPDSQLSITAVVLPPCVEQSCSAAHYNAADDENNESNIKTVSATSAPSSNVTVGGNSLSVVSLPSPVVTNDDNIIVDKDLKCKWRETMSTTADNYKSTDESKNDSSHQSKNNVISESENYKMGSSKHILDFQDDSNNISSPLHIGEGLSCIIANVESKVDTMAENEQDLDFANESELRENLYDDDDDYENMDSDDQVIATGLKSLSSEESTSNIFAPVAADDEKETVNQSTSKQVTSPKLSLKRNRNIESPDHTIEKRDGVKKFKLLDSSLSSDVIQEQNSSNFSLVPFNITTDEKNKKRFKELLEFSKPLMEETSEIEKEKIVRNMLKKLNETQLWYAGSETFSSLIDTTQERLNDQNSHENVFSVLQDVRKEIKKFKCKFKPTVIKENNADTNSGGSFSIKISAVEGNTDSSSTTDRRPNPSLLDEVTDHFSNVKNNINGFSLSNIESLPTKFSESSSNDCKIENEVQSTSYRSALEETLKNLDCTADKATSGLKSIPLTFSSKNLAQAPSVLQELSPSNSPVPDVDDERTSVRNSCTSSFQSCSSILDSSKSCFSAGKKLSPSEKPSNLEPLPSCSYNVNSNSGSSLEKFSSSQRTSNKEPEWDGGSSLSIASCIPVDKINDTLSVLKKEKSINEIIHEPEDSREQRRINRLEKQLEKLDRKIKKLQEKELSLDDLDDEESAYILEDKYIKRFKVVWDTLCKLKKLPSRTGRFVEKKFKYEGTRFNEINRAIEKMINKRKAHEKFPDFVEVLTIVKNVNDVHDIGLNERSVTIEAERVFQDIGRELKERRIRDNKELLGCHLTDGVDLTNDPAEHNEELKKTLEANNQKFEESINKVIDSYAEKQKKMPMEEDKDDKNSSDNDEDLEEVDKEDLPLTDPGSDTSDSDKKPKKDIFEIVYDSDKSTDPNEETKARAKVKQEQQTVTNKSNVVPDVIDLDSDSMDDDLPSIQELISSR